MADSVCDSETAETEAANTAPIEKSDKEAGKERKASMSSSTPDDASVDGADEADAQRKRRESIRARLREREKRLTSLVRTTSGDGENSFLGQIRTVQEKMKQVEDEKSALAKELSKLQNATSGDDFLKEKMAGIQEGFQKQVKVIQKLEDEVLAKNNEIDHLRHELVAKLRRIVELEFDLETHDVHYTDYAAEQFKLGEEALAEIKAMEKDGVNDVSGSENKLSPRRAQKLISKLLADLDNLEARYKEEKLENATKLGKVELKNEELRTRIHVLESRLGDQTSAMEDASETSMSSTDRMNLTFLRKRVETLEAKRIIYRDEVSQLHKDLSTTKKECQEEIKKIESDSNRLRLENEAMKSRIVALETGILDEDSAKSQYSNIERLIVEKSDLVARLGAEIDIKDRQIESLKKDVTKLRMKGIASKDADRQGESTYSDLDADLLREDIRREQHNAAKDGADPSYVEELQRQLQSAQQQLVKKDQELVIERAKAASTAAGLLARITELSSRQISDDASVAESVTSRASKDGGRKSGRKRDGKKKRPLRFYL